jgi:RNA ligase (TIGR02306 family)
MSERALATIRKIQEVKPIEGADLIEAVRVDNWWVVAKKGQHPVNSLAIYCEIDSFVPNTIAPFLTNQGHFPKEYQGIQGERLKTIKLKGQVSQGLLLDISVLGDVAINFFNESNRWAVGVIDDESCDFKEFIFEGDDVTERLDILKWEPPQEFLAANPKGTFPSFIPNTDQERIQNLKQSEIQSFIDSGVERSEKIDGRSMTVFIKDGVVGVCSRNLELKEDENNTFWKTAKSSGAVNAVETEALFGTIPDLAIQGELIGPGIQGNSYELTEHSFVVYDIYNITQQSYMLPQDVQIFCKQADLKHVPVLESFTWTTETVAELLKRAEGTSELWKTPREGDVYKSKTHPDVSFKVISNQFLIKTGK